MQAPQLLLLVLYLTIVVSLVWARFRFFKITASVKNKYVYLYDPAAFAQIAATLYLFSSKSASLNSVDIVLGAIGYTTSLGVFWWALRTAERLDFAFSKNTEKLLTKGPYALIRHPFYFSYSLAWMTSTFMFNNFILWITLSYMMAYYYFAAKSEEETILTSDHSEEYRLYSQTAGMFLPRITKWKSWK